MQHEGTSGTVSGNATTHYLYNGKELNTDLGLDWYDYGFRWYDAELGRFPSVDPIIENFPDLTPYNYASNNPSTLIDLWGLQGVYPNPTSPTQYLNGSLSAFGTQFSQARSDTRKDNKEYGYGIFTDGKDVYITKRFAGVGEQVDVGWGITELKNKNSGEGEVLLTSASGVKIKYKKDIHFFVGVYHTHPAIGLDNNPLSTGDILSFLSTIEDTRYVTEKGTGFFIISDETDMIDEVEVGGRYAVVAEDINSALAYYPTVHPFYIKKRSPEGRTYQEAGKYLKSPPYSEGQKPPPNGPVNRTLHGMMFYSGSGIGVYYNNSINSTNLNRINTNRRFFNDYYRTPVSIPRINSVGLR